MSGEGWLAAGGVFETLRTYENRPFGLELHLARLQLGISELGISNFDRQQLTEQLTEELMKSPFESGHLRIVVDREGGIEILHKRYQPPQEALRCLTIRSNLGQGLQFKSTEYRERFGLRERAIACGVDDALLFNREAELVEATTCNLIILTNDGWLTPALSSGCLPGITRKLLIENFGVREQRIELVALAEAKAAAVISSLREIQGITEIDGKVLPNSREVEVLKTQFHSWVLGNLAL